jgi:hypothetical protein
MAFLLRFHTGSFPRMGLVPESGVAPGPAAFAGRFRPPAAGVAGEPAAPARGLGFVPLARKRVATVRA